MAARVLPHVAFARVPCAPRDGRAMMPRVAPPAAAAMRAGACAAGASAGGSGVSHTLLRVALLLRLTRSWLAQATS